MIQNENNFTDSEILALIKLILYVKFESEDTESLLYAGSDLLNTALEKMLRQHPYYRDRGLSFFGKLPKENIDFIINRIENSSKINPMDASTKIDLLTHCIYPYTS
jgi:hypothetical protein